MAAATTRARPIVFLIDVDNTLLDNDRIVADLRSHLTHEVGAEDAERYFEVLEELRTELGYVDYLGALQRCRAAQPRNQRLLAVSSFLLSYPFARRLFSGSLDVLERFAIFGRTVVLSDGDGVFQPLKIERSGLAAAVAGRVLVYIHKEQELDDIEARFPADHYVLVDDKIRILTAVKQRWGDRVTTVFPRQGHYARQGMAKGDLRPDVSVEHIGDLRDWDGPATLRDGLPRNEEGGWTP